MIPAPARDRLAKVLGLLGSDAAGERAAAGLLASRLLRELGLSWSDVLASAPAAAPVVTADHRLAARLCLASAVPWGAWELAFLRGVSRRHGVTVRQERALLRLCRRAGVCFVPYD